MKITNETINNKPTFKNMGTLSKTLYTLSNNDMLNASAIDIFAMDTPRTIIEFKHRGKNAGMEMGFREYTGTFIAEFSAALFALITSKAVSKLYKPQIPVNADTWATNKALETFNEIFKSSQNTPQDFIKNSLNSIVGLAGKNRVHFNQVPPEKAEPIIQTLTDVITNPKTKQETTKILSKVQTSIIDVLGADNNITVNAANKSFSANLTHVLRDMTDLGKNVFFKEGVKNTDEIINKLKTINKSRIFIAIPLSMLLAITNQYINRQLTKRRTGIDNFVGENNYEQNVKSGNEQKKEKGLIYKKMLSAGVFLTMLTKVMGVKKPSDFISKLEFDGPATSGNAIKTIYGTLITGRIFAAKDSTELRETTVRDYLGFLSWLVLGGFAAKAVGQALDPKQEVLFNVSKQGKGLVHWLKDVSLKSQKEVIAQGGNVAKNLAKLNIAQLSGIAYSAVMLGVLLPKLNIAMTKSKKPKQEAINNMNNFTLYSSMETFEKEIAKRRN